jgi:formylglycine-generating enzyme required for sulfatase activity
MAQADLELLITQPGGQSFGLTLRFRHPAANLDKPFSALWTLDEAALRQRETDPAAYGECLASQLLAGPGARAFFDQALDTAAAQRIPLHLRLFISNEARALHSLRWETLRLPDSVAPLAAGEWVRFSRYLDSAGWRPASVPQQGSLTALIAIASPDVTGTTLAEVRTGDELIAARAGLAGIHAAELATRGQVTLPNLLARLRDGCDILYLVAHGMVVDGEPQVLLETVDGGRAWTPGAELAARLDEMAQPPSLALLLSCQSAGTGDADQAGQDDGALAGLGPRLAAAGVPAVVAMQGNFSMTTAAAFTPVFLAELRRDGQVDRAMAIARGAVQHRPDWWMPVLFTRLPDGCIWVPSSPDALPEIARQNFEPETIYIPEGSFLMGSGDPTAPAWERPPVNVYLPAYRIGRRPVTHREFARFVSEEKRLAAAEWGWQGQKAPDELLDQPVTGVTWNDALAYCHWLSKTNTRQRQYTLPSEAQWEKAAAGAYGCQEMPGSAPEWTRSLWGERRKEPDARYATPGDDADRNDLTASNVVRRVYRGGAAAGDIDNQCLTTRHGAAPDSPGLPGKRFGLRVVMNLRASEETQ